MTDDLVARLPDAAARRRPDFIRTLRINREKRRESVYASDNVYALLDALDAAEARVRELEDRVGVLEHDLDAHIAGHRLSANEATKHLMRIRELEAELAEAYERAAKVAETEGVSPEMNVHGGGPGWYRHGLRIAGAIRKLGQEVKHEAE